MSLAHFSHTYANNFTSKTKLIYNLLHLIIKKFNRVKNRYTKLSTNKRIFERNYFTEFTVLL